MSRIVLDDKFDQATGDINPPYFTTGDYIVEVQSIRENNGFKGLRIIGNAKILWSSGGQALPVGSEAGQVITPKAGTSWQNDVKNLCSAVWETFRQLAMNPQMRQQMQAAIPQFVQTVTIPDKSPQEMQLFYQQAPGELFQLIAQATQVDSRALPRSAVYVTLAPGNIAQGLKLKLRANTHPQQKDTSKVFTDHDWTACTAEDLKLLQPASTGANGVQQATA